MKHKNNYRYLLMGLVMALVSSAVMLSCKDDDPSLAELRDDKIAYLADSLRVSDSLRRLNQAGVVNYAITVVSGSTSSLFRQEETRTNATKDVVEGALVTISQFGKIVTDTTDASGMVVLNGFFRGAVNVVVRKADFTTAAFVIAVKFQDTTANGTINFVGNLIPIFETTGANTATVSGVAKIQSNLTNTTRENAPAGTTLIAHIDAMDEDFVARFLSANPPVDGTGGTGGSVVILDGIFLEASYATGVIGTVAADGTYSVTIPSAVDGLPTMFEYSDVALDRVRFETGDDPNSSNRTMTERSIYSPNMGSSYVPPAGGVNITFDGGTGATAAANVTQVGTVESATVTNGGSGYSGTPLVQLIGGGGSGATATAVVSNGVVTGVNIVNKGTGYTGAPAVSILAGSGASASSTLDTNGTVLSVSVLNSGSGYTSVPTVTFSGGGAPTTIATATAVLSAGRVSAINVTNAGAGYTSAPTVAVTGGGFTVQATAQANFSGVSVATVVLGAVGGNYNYAPSVTFSAPPLSTGIRATGVATVDATSGAVTGIQLTNPGSGYSVGVPPTVTLNAGSAATATAYLTGSSIHSITVGTQGNNYVAPPTVKITPTAGNGGSGAAATAIVVGGKVTAINVTNGGIGYTAGQVNVELISGEGAQGVATIGANGAITGVRITTNGSGYTGTPLVTFTGIGGQGNGATGTATIANNQVTGVTITAGGSGYANGNTPGDTSDDFEAMIEPYETFWMKSGVKYINDIYYGSGTARPN